MKRALLLINPNSRNGRSDIETAIDILRDGGIELVKPTSDKDCDFERGIAEQGQDCDFVIVGGGDGTLSGAIQGLLRLGRPFGILPLGTANDLARTLELPDNPEDCARVIVEGKTRRIDLGRANDRHFFNVASLGVSSDVARGLDRDLKARYGVFGYAVSLWRAVAKRRVIKADIVCDGQASKVRAIQISIGNGRFYGGGMVIAADASIDDGTLDLIIVAPQTIWQLIRRLPVFRWGHHDLNKTVCHIRSQEIDLKTRSSLPINTDGEVTTETPATFRLLPKALEVFVLEASYQDHPAQDDDPAVADRQTSGSAYSAVGNIGDTWCSEE